MLRGKPIRASILLALALALGVPLLVLGTVGSLLFVREQERRAADRVREAADTIALQVEQNLQHHLRSVIGLAAALEPLRDDPRGMARQLRHHRATFPGFLTMVVTDDLGRIVAGAPVATAEGTPLLGLSVADREYVERPLATGRPFLSGIFRGRGLGTDATVAASAPIGSPAPWGVVEGSLGLEELDAAVGVYRGESGLQILVADARGRVAFASPGLGVEPFEAVTVDPEGRVLESLDGDELLGAVHTRAVTPESGWCVVVRWPRRLVHQGSIGFLGLVGLLGVGGLAAASLMAREEALRVARPLERLAEQVRGFASRELGRSDETRLDEVASAVDRLVRPRWSPAAFAPPAEVQEVAAAFGALSHELSDSYRALGKTNAELRWVLAELERRVEERTAQLRARAEILGAVEEAARTFLERGWLDGVDTALARLGRAAGASRVLLFDVQIRAAGSHLQGEWSDDVAPPVSADDIGRRVAWFGDHLEELAVSLRSRELLSFGESSSSGAARLLLETVGAKSMICAPIWIGEELWGALEVDDCRQERAWSDGELRAFWAATRMVAAAIERDRVESALRLSEASSREIVEQSFGVVATHARDGTLLTMNPAGCELLGYRLDELVGRRLEELLADGSREELLLVLEKLPESGRGEGLISLRARSGEVRSLLYRNRWVGEAQEPYVIVHALDVTERLRAEELLRHQAFHDPLTGCANRALFADRFQQALDTAERKSHETTTPLRVALLYVDLDGFKEVNDEHGHEAGDRVLCEVAERLRSGVRRVDTVARLGGDEFGIVLPEVGSAADGVVVARALIDAVAEPIHVRGRVMPVGVSVGVAVYPDHGEDRESLMRIADAAMYAAKRTGRGMLQVGREGTEP